MPPAVLDRAFFRNLFRQTEADEFLIEHPKTGILMVLVPEGKFLSNTERAPLEVNLPTFYVGVHPVTNAQYALFVAETGCRPPGNRIWKEAGRMHHPVVSVDKDDATAYCHWAGLRLPTKQEWEKAARGLDGRAFPWGENWDPKRCRNFVNKGAETTASGWRYAQGGSPFGGLQLSGNVWEWCADGMARGGSWNRGGPRRFYGDPWANGRRHLAPYYYDGNDFSTRGGRLHPSVDSCGFRCVGGVGASA